MKYIFLLLLINVNQASHFGLPIKSKDIALTEIGNFGVERKARPGIPAHLHSGIDIRPPNNNYLTQEYIYPIAKGVVISKRTDGPFAQLIIEHELEGEILWTVYEHIAAIEVDLFEPVKKGTTIARFFLANELDNIGWQFNHFHFEILRKRPIELKPSHKNPERLFSSYSLSCHSPEDLIEHFYDPVVFLADKVLF
ncbi:M23 family metallopeptidase [Ekhidna sp.]|uniref:M23 family metallopeptidase n=1 Tax=Ekhidna sp. TaxID=2608089 RepID=UPI003B50C532